MQVAFTTTAMRLLTKSAVLVFTTLCTTFAQAGVQITKDYGDYLHVSIKGTITDFDAREFQALTNQLASRRGFTVILDSEGGAVPASMQIGRLIRRYDGRIVILKNSKCYSACALIFIAGIERNNSGELGLHRPYLSSAPQSRESIEMAIPAMLSQMKSYVAEMGVTDNFFQQMVNTEPSKLVVYRSNYTNLIPQIDPVTEELLIAQEARTYGISTFEVRKRKQDAERICGTGNPFDQLLPCWQAVLWGLSQPIYAERNSDADQKCAYSAEEKSIMARTPEKSTWDLPFFIRHGICVRKIMLGH